MRNIEHNKIFAAILIASLVIMISSKIANLLYRPVLDPYSRGYQIELSDNIDKEVEIEVDPFLDINIKDLMLSANKEEGKKLFKKCIMCHSIAEGGKNKIGPNLWNIVNAKKASNSSYNYSNALSQYGGIWDVESLFKFLYNPKQYVEGTSMSFIGIKNFQNIANIIKYLESQGNL